MDWEVYLGLPALLSDSRDLEHGWAVGQASNQFPDRHFFSVTGVLVSRC